MLYYLYSNGDLIGFKYNNDSYYYIKNNQDDIIGILDSSYNIVAKYTYDSWGNIISITDGNNNDISLNNTHIANINPFRYRSYYYDKETKLYYLNSRYYNPLWGRFINADSVINSNRDILSHNLYLYCSNDPINKIDSSGRGWFKKIVKNAKKNIDKVIKTVSNAFNAVRKAFVLDVGVGIGAEVGNNLGGIGYYNDKTLKVEKGQVKTGNAIGLYATLKNNKSNISIGEEYFHSPHNVNGDYHESIKHSQFMPLINDIKNCSKTEINLSTSSKPTDNTTADFNTKDTYFIGLDISGHIGVGGHIKIGFNIPWDMN